jgi:hypothetical protein
MAMLRPTEESEAFVDILSAPGLVNGFLAEPGDCAVIRSERPARLQLKIRAQGVEGSLDASFRIEAILGAGGRAVDAEQPRIAAPEKAGAAFELVAHVARRGDVAVDPDGWIAGPESPAAIEAVGIRGLLPTGVGIEIQPLLGTNPPRWLDWAPSGAFVGTRGRALPLAGLRLRLTGPQSAQWRLAVDALFLGSPIMTREGREVEIVGPAGNEPLVGLRVGLVMEPDQQEGLVGVSASVEADQVERMKESRMKVFRASGGG